MEIVILGSGGCTPIPRPLCRCRVCEEARKKGVPYSRSGPSMFLKDINALFDTPEDIAAQLNRENIEQLDAIFYTHWEPDHTLGMRIVEEINMYWLAKYVDGKEPERKIAIYALEEVMSDLLSIKNRYGSYFKYYESIGVASLNTLKDNIPFKINNFRITPISVKNNATSTVFLIEEDDKKVIYAPCDVKPFPIANAKLSNADVLIIGNVIPDEPLKDNYFVPQDNELRHEMFSMNEIIEIKERLAVERVVITHIEEEWGKSFDDYKKLEQKYEQFNIRFAYDGMKIKL